MFDVPTTLTKNNAAIPSTITANVNIILNTNILSINIKGISAIFFNIWDDNIIANDIATSTSGIKNILPLPNNFSTNTTPIASFSIKYDIIANKMVIPNAVTNCQSPIGLVSDNIQEDAVIAAAIPTNTKIKLTGLTFVFLNATTPAAIFSILNATIANIAAISTAVTIWPNDIGLTNPNTQDDTVIAVAIPSRVLISSVGLTFSLSNITTATPILCILNAIIENTAAIAIAVIACAKLIGIINWNAQEEAVIAADIETKVVNSANLLTFSLSNKIVAVNIFTNDLDITAKVAAIKIAVNNCVNPIGFIRLNTQDDTVSAADIITIVKEAIAACFIDKLSLAIFSNAIEISTIANPKDITDKKSTLPTNLNAIPIANTATAISKIVATPFLIWPFFFSPPDSSIASVFFSPPFCFCNWMIVSWFFKIFWVSTFIDLTLVLISVNCLEKSPLFKAEVVADWPLSSPFFPSASEIFSRETDKLSNAFNSILSIKNFYFQSIYKKRKSFLEYILYIKR